MPKKVKVIYLACKHQGIIGIEQRPRIQQLLCRHKRTIEGYHCSAHGLQRISGTDIYTVCIDCGKIVNEEHTYYD